MVVIVSVVSFRWQTCTNRIRICTTPAPSRWWAPRVVVWNHIELAALVVSEATLSVRFPEIASMRPRGVGQRAGARARQPFDREVGLGQDVGFGVGEGAVQAIVGTGAAVQQPGVRQAAGQLGNERALAEPMRSRLVRLAALMVRPAPPLIRLLRYVLRALMRSPVCPSRVI